MPVLTSSRARRAASHYFAVLVFAMFSAFPPAAYSQSVSLSPQQQAMIDQLPASQRQEAMRALREMQQGQANGAGELSSLGEQSERRRSLEVDGAEDSDDIAGVARAAGGSSLIISFDRREDLSRDEQQKFENDVALQSVDGTGYYELTRDGGLILPGLTTVALLGLDAYQIEQRLMAEQDLQLFEISVSILQTEATGTDALEPFGYEMFESDQAGFEPVMSGPVPTDYVLGPGDSVRVQLFGNVNEIYEFEVSRDGVLNLPELGPITVAGLPFSEFRQDIDRRVQQMLIGTQVSVTMGQLRSIRVFVTGDANRPSSYVVSSLATISTALYRSGGVSRVGSLRNIQLKRSGATVATFDLYDLLLNGDTSDDLRLQAGDAIFVPPVGSQVSVTGAVRRPAIYELRGNVKLSELIRLAGGFNADAYPDAATIERIGDSRQRMIVSIDADSEAASRTDVRSGDVIRIPEVAPELEQSVELHGHVRRPGAREWRPGMQLTDLIASPAELQPGADSNYVLIRRVNESDREISVLSASLAQALESPDSDANIRLEPRDNVFLFSREFGRQRVVQPILDELKLQARSGAPFREVSISGEVQAPGTYPLEPGMRVSDLIRAGGSLSEAAYAVRAELVRYEVVDNEFRSTQVVNVDLAAVLAGDSNADALLQEHDNLRISGLPAWDTLWTVELEGEVTFPGSYRIRRGETLSDVLDRAGGLTDAAFPEGAIFLRDSLQAREQEQIEILARRLESDLTSLSLESENTSGTDTLATGRALLSQLRSTEAVGRLVINLDQILQSAGRANIVHDVELRDGDKLLVPNQAQSVTVIGETQQNTSHLYRPELSRDDYIALSGGLTRRADRKLIYVVRASGAVVTDSRSKWFARRDTSAIRPGDTIVVPLETDRIRPLTMWSNVTQILYQAAIAVAAIQTFNN